MLSLEKRPTVTRKEAYCRAHTFEGKAKQSYLHFTTYTLLHTLSYSYTLLHTTVSSSEGKAKQNFHAVVGRERSGCAIYYKTISWFAVDLGKGPSTQTQRRLRSQRGRFLETRTPCAKT